jgi:hypothetical protein
LIGLIWHIHIALLPALIAIPAAILVSRKLPGKKNVLQFLITLFVSSIPLILFETRHGFSQTKSFMTNFTAHNQTGISGINKFVEVLEMITKNINALLFQPQFFQITSNPFFVIFILLSAIFLFKKKLLKLKELIVFAVWISGVILFYTLTSSPISEYYFYNIEIIFLTIISFYLYLLTKIPFLGKILVLGILLLILGKNVYSVTTRTYYHKGYIERKAVVDYIKRDALEKGFPCVGISYIAVPGENVGFRYFFYLRGMHLVHPSFDIPVYNIVIPDELAWREVKLKFGHIGVIPPDNIPAKEIIGKSCQTPDTNLTDPMFGYVE